MSNAQPTNGSGGRRQELALVEIEALCANMLHDLRVLKASVECIQAECKEVRWGAETGAVPGP
jgi:hypothetical protein